jgi:sirohydrochlorin ferrochelatase
MPFSSSTGAARPGVSGSAPSSGSTYSRVRLGDLQASAVLLGPDPHVGQPAGPLGGSDTHPVVGHLDTQLVADGDQDVDMLGLRVASGVGQGLADDRQQVVVQARGRRRGEGSLYA